MLPLEVAAVRAELTALDAAPPLRARAAKGVQLLALGLAVNTVAPAALALLSPSWGAYLGCLLTGVLVTSVPLDALAGAVLAFAGQ